MPVMVKNHAKLRLTGSAGVNEELAPEAESQLTAAIGWSNAGSSLSVYSSLGM